GPCSSSPPPVPATPWPSAGTAAPAPCSTPCDDTYGRLRSVAALPGERCCGSHRSSSRCGGDLAYRVRDRELRIQNWKHSIRLPIEVRPSRGGAGGPQRPVAALLSLLGVRVSKVWLIEARVGSPNAASMNLSVELCSYTVGSRCPGRAKGEMTHVGTR